jgi:hypothetical protein
MKDMMDDDGNVAPLPCDSCALKDWGTHPSRDAPWCTEQFVMPVLMQTGEDEYGAPAVLTLQRSGVKPAKSYMSSFVRQRKALFTAVTRLTLTAQKRGQTEYAVPTLTKVGTTDPEMHAEWAEQFRAIRDQLKTRYVEDDVVENEDGETRRQERRRDRRRLHAHLSRRLPSREGVEPRRGWRR